MILCIAGKLEFNNNIMLVGHNFQAIRNFQKYFFIIPIIYVMTIT